MCCELWPVTLVYFVCVVCVCVCVCCMGHALYVGHASIYACPPSLPSCLCINHVLLSGQLCHPMISIQTSPPTQATAKCSHSCTKSDTCQLCGLALLSPDIPQRLQLPLLTVVVPPCSATFSASFREDRKT